MKKIKFSISFYLIFFSTTPIMLYLIYEYINGVENFEYLIENFIYYILGLVFLPAFLENHYSIKYKEKIDNKKDS